MIPVKQTGNNCGYACVASILEVPIESLPPYPAPDWLAKLQHWLIQRNLFYVSSSANGQVPPGYAILLTRVTGYPCELHSLVCLNGEVVWDPNGYHLPKAWNGIIEERDWQIAEPIAWVSFGILDPLKPAGVPAATIGPPFAEIIARAHAFFELVNKKHPPVRLGITFAAVADAAPQIAAAYADATTDEEGEKNVLEVLRGLRQQGAALQMQ
jgi:hypothetical protein